MIDLSVETGTTGLNGLDLSLGVGQTVEALRQVVPVKVFTLPWLHWTQGRTGVPANSALSERSATKRAVLLGLDTVGSERVGEAPGRRQRVGSRTVVYLCYTS